MALPIFVNKLITIVAYLLLFVHAVRQLQFIDESHQCESGEVSKYGNPIRNDVRLLCGGGKEIEITLETSQDFEGRLLRLQR